MPPSKTLATRLWSNIGGSCRYLPRYDYSRLGCIQAWSTPKDHLPRHCRPSQTARPGNATHTTNTDTHTGTTSSSRAYIKRAAPPRDSFKMPDAIIGPATRPRLDDPASLPLTRKYRRQPLDNNNSKVKQQQTYRNLIIGPASSSSRVRVRSFQDKIVFPRCQYHPSLIDPITFTLCRAFLQSRPFHRCPPNRYFPGASEFRRTFPRCHANSDVNPPLKHPI